jgi:hypothetical protein
VITVAQRTESVLRDAVGPLMKAAGFRRKRMVFRRTHGDLVQVVQVYAQVTVSGGASPAKGFFRIWVGLGPATLASKAPYEYECGAHIELREGVPSPHRTWPVPPTRGPTRAAIAADLAIAFGALLRTLDLVTTLEQVTALVEEATQNRIWQREPVAWPKRHTRQSPKTAARAKKP